MISLWLVRHGLTDWNSEKRYQGQNQTPLNELGRAQARALGQKLATIQPAVVFSSDLPRALETARIAIRGPIVSDARLREPDYGQFQGCTYGEMEALTPTVYRRWQADRSVPPPDGEPVTAVLERIRDFVAQLRSTYPQQQVIAVSHGELIALMLAELSGCDPAQFRQFTPDNASVTTVRLERETARIEIFNDTSHLEN